MTASTRVLCLAMVAVGLLCAVAPPVWAGSDESASSQYLVARRINPYTAKLASAKADLTRAEAAFLKLMQGGATDNTRLVSAFYTYMRARSALESVQKLYDAWEKANSQPKPEPGHFRTVKVRILRRLIPGVVMPMARTAQAEGAEAQESDVDTEDKDELDAQEEDDGDQAQSSAATVMRRYRPVRQAVRYVAVENYGSRSARRWLVVRGANVVAPYAGRDVMLRGSYQRTATYRGRVRAISAKPVAVDPVTKLETKRARIERTPRIIPLMAQSQNAVSAPDAVQKLGLLGSAPQGMKVSLKVGQTFEFGLEANPSTGYSWVAGFSPEGIAAVAREWTDAGTTKPAPDTNGLCARCEGRMYTMDSKRCSRCPGWTSSGAFTICRACAVKAGECMGCGARLSGPIVVGGSTTAWWSIKGVKAGTTTLRLAYRRPWENRTVRSFEVGITVVGPVIIPPTGADYVAVADGVRYKVTEATEKVVSSFVGREVMLTGEFRRFGLLAQPQTAQSGATSQIMRLPDSTVRAVRAVPVGHPGQTDRKLVALTTIIMKSFPPQYVDTLVETTGTGSRSYRVTDGAEHLAPLRGQGRIFVTGIWSASAGTVAVRRAEPVMMMQHQGQEVQIKDGIKSLDNPFDE